METKTSQAIKYFQDKEFKNAFRIFATFRLNFTPDEIRTLSIVNETLDNSGRSLFYQSIDIDTDGEFEKAITLIKNKYKL